MRNTFMTGCCCLLTAEIPILLLAVAELCLACTRGSTDTSRVAVLSGTRAPCVSSAQTWCRPRLRSKWQQRSERDSRLLPTCLHSILASPRTRPPSAPHSVADATCCRRQLVSNSGCQRNVDWVKGSALPYLRCMLCAGQKVRQRACPYRKYSTGAHCQDLSPGELSQCT